MSEEVIEVHEQVDPETADAVWSATLSSGQVEVRVTLNGEWSAVFTDRPLPGIDTVAQTVLGADEVISSIAGEIRIARTEDIPPLKELLRQVRKVVWETQ